jgi:hypothetical protein
MVPGNAQDPRSEHGDGSFRGSCFRGLLTGPCRVQTGDAAEVAAAYRAATSSQFTRLHSWVT